MDTAKLKKFAQHARRHLLDQVGAKLSYVLADGSSARREEPKAVEELESQIRQSSKPQVIEKVAYIWFNRFCALRFMDANHYTDIGVVSPVEGFTQPEILAEAKQHHIDSNLDSFIDREKVFDLLEGRTPSNDPQQEAYRLLLVAVCNHYNSVMPYLFEKITDYTELLMPDDLLSESSILAEARKAMTVEVCKDVEVIGWLYQFYISEKKDDVFAALKKGKKIAPENIPAATQLFTPNWIVRYLVENSLGRLWMLNKPNSTLAKSMDYYIKPETPEAGFLKVSSPEELKVCDPACGSGHMLVYAFDLLYRIYEEEGYNPPDIPRLILRNNLYGIEIDERAGMLTYFALVMKAREKHSRFLKKPVQPHVCVLENVKFEQGEIKTYMDKVGHDLFTMNLQATLRQFEETDNLGSLIKPVETDVSSVRAMLEKKKIGSDLFLHPIHQKVLKALKQADYLSPKYHVVVANPPYMGKGMNTGLSTFGKDNFKDSKFDLFSMFVERIINFVPQGAFTGMMTPFTWMFLSSYEKLRTRILNRNTLTCLVRPEYHAFFDSAFVPVCGFVLFTNPLPQARGAFIDLNEFYGASVQPVKTLEAIQNPNCGWFYRVSASDFKKIPGSPIAYWASSRVINIFTKHDETYKISISEGQNITAQNDTYLRLNWEVDHSKIEPEGKWCFYSKGGAFRKWFGNLDYVVDWSDDARKHYHAHSSARIIPKYLRFREGITWTLLTSSKRSFRYLPSYATFDKTGSSIFFENPINLKKSLLFFNTTIAQYLLGIFNATFSLQVDDVRRLPMSPSLVDVDLSLFDQLIKTSKMDWDYSETSWDFMTLPIFQSDFRLSTLKTSYALIRKHWKKTVLEMQSLEKENNFNFLEAYGLHDDLKPDVPIEEITLTCNPHYRYGGEKTEEELEAMLLADTMREFISYAVGCMFGRYSIDKPGLILANQGDTYDDFLKAVPNPTFEPDDDNVLPLMDVEWFTDDIADRFKKFLRVTFGDEHYEENLRFIEEAIGKDIRKYFLKDFYTHHLKMYKKRPIYWMFSSPKGSFNALIYMHRYQPDTVSVVLNDYLREFRTKLIARREHLEGVANTESTPQREKTKALKEIESLKKIISELDDYERDTLYPLATQRIEIDLDDGVKVNYNKFGKALKKVTGLSE